MLDFAQILKLDPNARKKTYKKGDILQHEGDAKAFTFLVKKGLLRSYIIDSTGKEHIYVFAPEGWIIGDIEAMGYDQPVELIIDCLEESEVISFDKDCFFQADLTKDQFAENAQFLYRRIGRLQRRVLMLMGSPASDRYTYFLSMYPNLANRIPQRMIATYLGITPQALSTIRGRIARSE